MDFARATLIPLLFLALPPVLFAGQDQPLLPLFQKYCVECHGPTEHKAELDLLAPETQQRLNEDHDLLETLEWVVAEQEMPPRKSPQPTAVERALLVELLHARLERLEQTAPNDPGLVLMPRLNQAEYNHVIRDLTGFDLEPARFFPADEIADNGFANMGAVLNVGMLHAENYLSGAKWVLRHAYVSPERGIVWHPTQIETDGLEKLRETLLTHWYGWLARKEAALFGQKPEDGADWAVLNAGEYLFAAWKYRHRAVLGRPEASLAEFAAEAEGRVTPVILERWVALLEREDHTPLVGRLAEGWRALPAPGAVPPEQVRQHCALLEEFLYGNTSPLYNDRWFQIGARFTHRPEWESSEPNEPRGRRLQRYQRRGFPDWARHLMEEGRYDFTIETDKLNTRTLYLVVTDAWDGADGDRVRLTDRRWNSMDWEEAGIEVEVVHGEAPLIDGEDWILQAPVTLALQLPKEEKAELKGSFRLNPEAKEVASVQTLFLTEPPKSYERHYYPSRQVLAWPAKRKAVQRMVADISNLFARSTKLGGSELSTALAAVPEIDDRDLERLGGLTDTSQYPDAPYFIDRDHLVRSLTPEEKSEYDALVADLQAYAEVPYQRLAAAYEKAGIETVGGADLLDPVKRGELKGQEKWLREVEAIEMRRRQSAQRILSEFLRAAWRRPIAEAELEHYLGLYDESRRAGKTFDAAVKRPLTVALLVPDFLFKMQAAAPGEVAQLTDVELASRLAFFLWASMPDERLLTLAEQGELSQLEVLLAEADRMLRDPKSRGFAQEFAGRWLGFYGFDDYSQPDMDKFPEFTESLRAAMYEESLLFFQNLFAENRPITDLIAADYLFLNEELAAHYAIEGVEGSEMRKVSLNREDARKRGGIFGFGSLLTVNSTPLRAHPIYRGIWIIDRILGTPTPEPPPVPPLGEAAKPGEDLAFHELLARHRADPSCVVCHDRIDPPGLALEHFNAVGAWRETDDDGKPVYARGKLPDGRIVEGLEGVRLFVSERKDDLVDQFCRKLAIFGLGRELTATDRPLLQQMAAAIKADQYRVRAALGVLITSPQFLQKRIEQSVPDSLATR